MSELLAVALRMMAPRRRVLHDDADGGLTPLPTGLPYGDYVRRFDPTADPLMAVTRATAVAHLVRIHRTLDTLNGLARERGTRAASLGAEHLYQAHGEPRD